MRLPFCIAVAAAISAASGQEVTETVTRCTTSYGMFAPSSGTAIETAYFFTTTTNSFTITSTTQETITVTPSATTFTDVVNVTSTFFSTVTSVPAATTIPAPAGFFPLINSGTPTATATAIGRHRRALVESRAEHLHKVKRQTLPGYTGGFLFLPDGNTQSLDRVFAHSVECRISVNINSTETTIVTGLPTTETLVPATVAAAAVSTSTVSVTSTVIEVQAQSTEYAACQPNNVVSNVLGFDNAPIYFDRIVFRPNEGFPIANSLVVNTTSAVNCCIACQNTPFCAGSFYAPSVQVCHLQLTQAAPASSIPELPASSSVAPFPVPGSNTTLAFPTGSGAPFPADNGTAGLFPTGTGLVPSGFLPSGFSTLIPSATPISSNGTMSILPISAPASTGTVENPGSGTCSIGSLSLYLGTIRGQNDFPANVAVSFSNGPCGRMSIDFEAVTPETNDLIARRMVMIG